MQKLIQALVKVQAELKPILTDSVNPHYRSKYASLAQVQSAILPILSKYEISLNQLGTYKDSQFVIETRLTHVSGESISSIWPVVSKDLNDPQKLGSAVSYARRYSLLAIVGVAQDDDDANQATDKSTFATITATNTSQGYQREGTEVKVSAQYRQDPDNYTETPKSAALPTQPAQSSYGPKKLSEAQIKRLWAKVAAQRYDKGLITSTIQKLYSKKPEDLNNQQYESICQLVDKRLVTIPKEPVAPPSEPQEPVFDMNEPNDNEELPF